MQYYPCMQPPQAPWIGYVSEWGYVPPGGYAQSAAYGAQPTAYGAAPAGYSPYPAARTPVMGGCPLGTEAYVVAAGESLAQIAGRYGLELGELMRVNPGVPEQPEPGQVLCLPNAPIPRPFPCPGTLYVIRPGDTLVGIARVHGITIADLLAANPQVNPNYYRVGDTLCIPEARPPQHNPCRQGAVLYVVEEGDTLADICVKAGTSVQALWEENPGFDPTRLTAGQQLCVVPMNCQPACPEDRQAKIRPGRDLFGAAEDFGFTADELLLANPAFPPCYFTGGNLICLPERG